MALMARQRRKSLIRVFNILSMLVLLSSCGASPNKAPVYDRAPPQSNKLGYHTVANGETLYAIAWRYGIDYKKLAARNGIGRNYTIYPGQKVYLYQTVAAKPPQKVAVKTSSHKTKPPRSKTTTASQKTSHYSVPASASVKWQWPTKGKVIAGFSSQKSLNKGVDIGGRMGEPVVAAASGVVVYGGSGIRGYGNLLIIKHSDKYLSAYAHNSKLFVKEQGVVKAGQKIAEIGNSGTDRSKLHFEIRRDGKPVDPLHYLPKR